MTSQSHDIQDRTATSVDVDDSSLGRTTDSTFEIDELIPVNPLTTRKYRIDANTTPTPMALTTEEGSGDVGTGLDNKGELFGFNAESLASDDDGVETTTDSFSDTTASPTSVSTEEGSGDIDSGFLTTDELFGIRTEYSIEITSIIDDTSTMTSDQGLDTSVLPPDDGSGDVDGALSTDKFIGKSTESPEMTTFTEVSSAATTNLEDEEQTTSEIMTSEEQTTSEMTSEEPFSTIDFRESSIPEEETTVFSVDISTQSTPQTSDISDVGSGDSDGDMSLDMLTTQEHVIFDLSTGGITTEDVGTSKITVQETTTDAFASQMKTTSDSMESAFSQDIEEITTESSEDATLEQTENISQFMSTRFSVPYQSTDLPSPIIETTSQSTEIDATNMEQELTTQNPDIKEISSSANVSTDIPEIDMVTTGPKIAHATSAIPDNVTVVTPKLVKAMTYTKETSTGVEEKSSTTEFPDFTVVEEVIGMVTVESVGGVKPGEPTSTPIATSRRSPSITAAASSTAYRSTSPIASTVSTITSTTVRTTIVPNVKTTRVVTTTVPSTQPATTMPSVQLPLSTTQPPTTVQLPISTTQPPTTVHFPISTTRPSRTIPSTQPHISTTQPSRTIPSTETSELTTQTPTTIISTIVSIPSPASTTVPQTTHPSTVPITSPSVTTTTSKILSTILSTTVTGDGLILEGKIKIVNGLEWTDELGDPSSDNYNELNEEMKTLVSRNLFLKTFTCSQCQLSPNAR